jgi:hypothetical protein
VAQVTSAADVAGDWTDVRQVTWQGTEADAAYDVVVDRAYGSDMWLARGPIGR